jgi:predicted RNase H-like HicB family nuclease
VTAFASGGNLCFYGRINRGASSPSPCYAAAARLILGATQFSRILVGQSDVHCAGKLYDGGTGGHMRNEFTAVVERAGRWHIAYCPEIPGANGQGRTKTAALKSLGSAIALILEDRRRDGLRGVPSSARREKVVVG